MTIASTDPSTLDAAFKAQAHSTAFASAGFVTTLVVEELEAGKVGTGAPARACRPVGKGIPMANPSGTSSTALTNSLMANGKPTSEERMSGRTKT